MDTQPVSTRAETQSPWAMEAKFYSFPAWYEHRGGPSHTVCDNICTLVLNHKYSFAKTRYSQKPFHMQPDWYRLQNQIYGGGKGMTFTAPVADCQRWPQCWNRAHALKVCFSVHSIPPRGSSVFIWGSSFFAFNQFTKLSFSAQLQSSQVKKQTTPCLQVAYFCCFYGSKTSPTLLFDTVLFDKSELKNAGADL